MDYARLRAVFGGGKTFSHGLGQKRKCPGSRGTSVLPSGADIVSLPQHVRLVPTTDIIDSAALRRFGHVNSLYEEPFFSCRQGGGSPPPAETGSPSPIRAVSEQHLHAVLSLVRRTGRRSSVPLASRPSWSIPNQCWPEAFPDGLLSRWSSLSHSCHPKLCICGKLFQILILLPFLHSPRRFFPRG